MAKIDTSQIEGYSEMSAEDKLAALESFEIQEPDMSGYVRKDQLDKAAHDAAEWKRKYNSKLSDEEKSQAEQKAYLEKVEEELNTLRRDKSVSDYTSKFIANGYDSELATATAEALADGDMETVFANQSKFVKSFEKHLKSEFMKGTPKPDAAGGGEGALVKTKADFLKLSTKEQMAYIQEHPDWKNLK